MYWVTESIRAYISVGRKDWDVRTTRSLFYHTVEREGTERKKHIILKLKRFGRCRIALVPRPTSLLSVLLSRILWSQQDIGKFQYVAQLLSKNSPQTHPRWNKWQLGTLKTFSRYELITNEVCGLMSLAYSVLSLSLTAFFLNHTIALFFSCYLLWLIGTHQLSSACTLTQPLK